jgi:hypothetical protein
MLKCGAKKIRKNGVRSAYMPYFYEVKSRQAKAFGEAVIRGVIKFFSYDFEKYASHIAHYY